MNSYYIYTVDDYRLLMKTDYGHRADEVRDFSLSMPQTEYFELNNQKFFPSDGGKPQVLTCIGIPAVHSRNPIVDRNTAG